MRYMTRGKDKTLPHLCSCCKEKKPDTSVRGTCLAASHIQQANLPREHLPWTDSPNVTLCNACGDHFGFCVWCWGPINGHGHISVPTDKSFVRTFEKENGLHIEGMDVGEQILAQFSIDRFMGQTWKVKELSCGIRLATTRMVQEDGGHDRWWWYGSRYAWLEFYFDLERSNPSAHIELVEDSVHHWRPISKPKIWRVTVEVRR